MEMADAQMRDKAGRCDCGYFLLFVDEAWTACWMHGNWLFILATTQSTGSDKWVIHCSFQWGKGTLN
jgi:hypothetical protein